MRVYLLCGMEISGDKWTMSGHSTLEAAKKALQSIHIKHPFCAMRIESVALNPRSPNMFSDLRIHAAERFYEKELDI